MIFNSKNQKNMVASLREDGTASLYIPKEYFREMPGTDRLNYQIRLNRLFPYEKEISSKKVTIFEKFFKDGENSRWEEIPNPGIRGFRRTSVGIGSSYGQSPGSVQSSFSVLENGEVCMYVTTIK